MKIIIASQEFGGLLLAKELANRGAEVVVIGDSFNSSLSDLQLVNELTLKSLSTLGFRESYESILKNIPKISVAHAKSFDELNSWDQETGSEFGFFLHYAFHQEDFVNSLEESVINSGVKIYPESEIQEILDFTDGVIVKTHDNLSFSGDLLVAADGINSQVRRLNDDKNPLEQTDWIRCVGSIDITNYKHKDYQKFGGKECNVFLDEESMIIMVDFEYRNELVFNLMVKKEKIYQFDPEKKIPLDNILKIDTDKPGTEIFSSIIDAISHWDPVLVNLVQDAHNLFPTPVYYLGFPENLHKGRTVYLGSAANFHSSKDFTSLYTAVQESHLLAKNIENIDMDDITSVNENLTLYEKKIRPNLIGHYRMMDSIIKKSGSFGITAEKKQSVFSKLLNIKI